MRSNRTQVDLWISRETKRTTHTNSRQKQGERERLWVEVLVLCARQGYIQLAATQ